MTGADFYGRTTGGPLSLAEYEKRFGKRPLVIYDHDENKFPNAVPIQMDNVTIVTDGKFVENKALEKLREEAYQLCMAIERLPASEQATDLSVKASAIHQKLQNLV